MIVAKSNEQKAINSLAKPLFRGRLFIAYCLLFIVATGGSV